jgi:cholesterol oxidase
VAVDFDAVVIGSGFGGAIAGCRLAEKGYRVLILERGRRWQVKDYPRKPADPWIWDHEHPEKKNGWLDFRLFPNMTVAQGAGVGGGSLVYANISVDAKPDTFESGWPVEITFDGMKPYYEAVGKMLNLQQVPDNQLPERTKLLKEAAQRSGYGGRFRKLDLAVSFDPAWHYGVKNPHHRRRSKEFINAQGQQQGTCIHLANCDIGCDVKAKNTLDLNYIPLAERHGAEVRPLHLVRHVSQENGGYSVHYDRVYRKTLRPGRVTGRIVILAAGSLGSTEILLRSRDQTRTLPRLSPRLGRNWSSNGDFLTPAIHPFRKVAPTRGPTITGAIDFLDGALDKQRFFIEDGGFPDLFGDYLRRLEKKKDHSGDRMRAVIGTVKLVLASGNALEHVMPWFAQGRDAADGTLLLKDGKLFLQWDVSASEPTINAIVRMHEGLAKSTAGIPLVPLTWTLLKDLITPHPLGGCNMATSPENGVVDHRGEVFGYRNLYVADGAIVPKALGLNPSKTIAALAERIAALIVKEGR